MNVTKRNDTLDRRARAAARSRDAKLQHAERTRKFARWKRTIKRRGGPFGCEQRQRAPIMPPDQVNDRTDAIVSGMLCVRAPETEVPAEDDGVK